MSRLKKLVLSVLLGAAPVILFAQPAPPQGVNYQAVARNASGAELANAPLTVRIGIYTDQAATVQVYEETHTVTTNAFGLFNVTIGQGTQTSVNAFNTISWANSAHYLKVELNSGSGFTDMGTTQLMSVPYALYAGSSAGGPTGPAGPTGLTGPAGPSGPSGDPGLIGPQGPAGPSGPSGDPGVAGPTGPSGDPGPTGLTGPAGHSGPRGDPGPTGLTGPAGPSGPSGDPGPAGPQGAAGANGATGATGATGPQGIQGPTGLQGLQGVQGPTGLQGVQGPTGPQGTAGAQGPTGAQGIQGPTGPQGAVGANGPTGPSGANGAAGPTGPSGANGAAGPTGATGATGPLVAGTTGQTLYHNGTTWAATNNLFHSASNNVGIGTTTPAYKLHVLGLPGTGMALDATGTSSVSYAMLDFITKGNGALPVNNAGSNGWSWMSYSNAFGTTALQNDLRLWYFAGTGATDVMFFESTNGRVGMGTITPQDHLHVDGAATTGGAEGIARFSVRDAGGSYLQLGNNSATDFIMEPKIFAMQQGSLMPSLTIEADNNNDAGNNPVIVINGKAAGDDVGFRPLFDVRDNGVSRLLINQDGNVGIGIAAPASKLQVEGGNAAVFTQITNTATGSFGSDGLFLGLSNTGDAFLSQNENRDLRIQMMGFSSIWLSPAGRVGIYGAPSAPYSFLAYNSANNPGLGLDANGITMGDVFGGSMGNYLFIDYEAAGNFQFMNGNVGIGTNAPSERLEVLGNVEIPATNDYKYASAKTQYYSVPGAAFFLENSSACDRAMIGGNIYTTGGSPATVAYFTAPVYLPHGATVTSVTFYVVDNDATYNTQNGQLWRNDASTFTSYGNSSNMATTAAPGNSANIQASTTSTITNPVIDNQNYTYWLRWGTQQANSNLRLAKVVITYTVTKAD